MEGGYPTKRYTEVGRGRGRAAGGVGGGFFGAGPGYTPADRRRSGARTPKTAGLDYIVTLFMRIDTPTGIGTPAWTPPRSAGTGWSTCIKQGHRGRQDPDAWKMLRRSGATPRRASAGRPPSANNVQPNGQPGTGGTGTGGTGGRRHQPDNQQCGGTLAGGRGDALGADQGRAAGGLWVRVNKLYQEMLQFRGAAGHGVRPSSPASSTGWTPCRARSWRPRSSTTPAWPPSPRPPRTARCRSRCSRRRTATPSSSRTSRRSRATSSTSRTRSRSRRGDRRGHPHGRPRPGSSGRRRACASMRPSSPS